MPASRFRDSIDSPPVSMPARTTRCRTPRATSTGKRRPGPAAPWSRSIPSTSRRAGTIRTAISRSTSDTAHGSGRPTRPSGSGACRSARLQIARIGVPYGAVSNSGVNPQPYVTNPGYVTPPSGITTTYYFTARDAFRTDGQERTDVAASYHHTLKSARGLQLFGQLQVLNVFNHYQLCGCGAATVFSDGGAVTDIPHRSDRAHRGDESDGVPGLQPVHDDARAGRQLGLRPKLRQSAEPVGVHHAAGPSGLTVRRAILKHAAFALSFGRWFPTICCAASPASHRVPIPIWLLRR